MTSLRRRRAPIIPLPSMPTLSANPVTSLPNVLKPRVRKHAPPRLPKEGDTPVPKAANAVKPRKAKPAKAKPRRASRGTKRQTARRSKDEDEDDDHSDIDVKDLGWTGTMEDLPPNAPSTLSPRSQLRHVNDDYLVFWTEADRMAQYQADTDAAILAHRARSVKPRAFLKDPRRRFVSNA